MRAQASIPMDATRPGIRRDIQGLRALAVMLVVVFHTGYAMPGGFIGVDVFFVLSGFLIIGLLDREAEREGRIALAEFFARRARRLLPALALVTTATVLLSALLVEIGAPLRSVARTAAGASLFVANAVLYREADYFAPAAERNPLLHTWSLSIEEQFYFVVPILLAIVVALLRRSRRGDGRRRRTWAMLIVLGSFVSFALNVYLVDLGRTVLGLQEPAMLAFYAPLTRAWQFGLGGALALWVATRGPSFGVRSDIPLGLGLGLILAAALTFDASVAFPGVRALVPVVGTLLALVPRIPADEPTPMGPIRHLLSAAPSVRVGDLSYGLYLWHWPAIVLTRAALGEAVAVTVGAVVMAYALAAVMFRSLEEPLRRDLRMVGPRALRLAVVCSAVPLALASVLLVVNERVADRVELALADRSWSRDDCHSGRDPSREWPVDRCTRGRADESSAQIDVLLIGDSHADSLSDAVLAATQDLGLSVGVWTVSGQPPHGDEAWVEAFERLIGVTDPAVVIVATRGTTPRYLGGELSDRWAPGLSTTLSLEEIEALWVESARRAVVRYREAGPAVIWVQNIPEFPVPPGLTEAGPTLLLRDRGFRSIGLPELEVQRGRVVAEESRVLGSIDGVSVLDPAPWLCTPDCVNGEDGIFFYYDDNHLTPAGSRLLIPAFVDRIAAVTGGPA